MIAPRSDLAPPLKAKLKAAREERIVTPSRSERPTRGLMVLKEPLDKILAGSKTWEIRGNATAIRGPIALIESKSGTVVGVCDVVDVTGPLSLAELNRNARKTGFSTSELPYSATYAWVLRNARRLRVPVSYRHPAGAIIWVKLSPSVIAKLPSV